MSYRLPYDDDDNCLVKMADCDFAIDNYNTRLEAEDDTFPGLILFWITPREYYAERGCFHDCFSEIADEPHDISNWMESQWGYMPRKGEVGKTVPELIAYLESLGAKHSPAMQDQLLQEDGE